MPDAWTHIITGEDIAFGIDSLHWQQMIKENINLFRFGCQGPDFFYYHNFWPWLKDKSGYYFGDAVHNRHCGEFLQQNARYIKNITNLDHKNKLTVYLIGLICHWVVDRTLHPYIFYISGTKSQAAHKLAEAAIDTILAFKKRGIDVTKTPVYSYVYLGEKLPEIIVELYMHVLTKLYLVGAPALPTAHLVRKSYQDMIKALKLFHDPYDIKRKLFKILDLITGNKFNAAAYFYRSIKEVSYDILNNNHRQWCHPCDKNELYTYSLWELLDMAQADAQKVIKAALGCLDSSRHNIDEYFTDISFTTGKETWDTRPMLYCKPKKFLEE
ncbi:MAG: zinc dependent phospholipase C family protein [Desulfotomaculum sp.]|nr:zinc dependent phospholipase C family protein [Desulfotomaculum sp.]